MKKLISLLLVCLISICLFTACNPDAEEIDWVNIRLGHVLPEPQSNLMRVFSNSDDSLSVYIYEISQNQYFEYQRWCEEDKGFTIDAEASGTSLYAYNAEGYHLSLSYYESQDQMHIDLNAPIPMEEYTLPSYALDAGLPVPESNIGHFRWKDDDHFFLYVGETTNDDFWLYKDACIAAGFTEDPYEYSKGYSAKNAEGYQVSLNYEGFNTFILQFRIPKEDDSMESDPTNAYDTADLLAYFDSDMVTALTEISCISGFDLSTSLYDEDCSRKPTAVLFFTVDSLDGDYAEDDYYEKVNNGGCIEIFENTSDAEGRDAYLTGFFLFGLTGGEHDAVNQYVIQVSDELSAADQKTLLDELVSILETPENETPDSPTDESEEQEGTTNLENLASVPDDWRNLLEKHYEEVRKQFEDAGFTNITCVAHEIDYNEDNVFEGSVINIAIGENGEICTFEKGVQWPKDIKIRIDYRVKPIGEEPPDSSVATPPSSTDNNPYNEVEDYSVYTKTEYAHIDSDVIRLGNEERLWITIEASPVTLSAYDFIVDFDETMLEIIDIASSTLENTLQIELTIKAKSPGISKILICSGYDLYENWENATFYVLTVNGLSSSDGRIVYVTRTGEKYHYSASCVASGIKTTLSDALAYEYEPCGKCAK